jgi:hypothetical protein
MMRGTGDGFRTARPPAQAGDIKAFVDLTRRYQHLAFGSTLAWIHDLQQAEDVVQVATPAIRRKPPGTD